MRRCRRRRHLRCRESSSAIDEASSIGSSISATRGCSAEKELRAKAVAAADAALAVVDTDAPASSRTIVVVEAFVGDDEGVGEKRPSSLSWTLKARTKAKRT